jgi:SAM-dependent methyltransferase
MINVLWPNRIQVILGQEVKAWRAILLARDSSFNQKLIQGWQHLKLYIYRLYWRMGNECEQWIRVVMKQETQQLIAGIKPTTLDVLEISGTQWQGFEFASYESLGYPDFDICKSATNRSYDLIIAEQVFEHLLWPYRAGRNVYSMLRPGGYFLITVPFLIRVHHCPVDCTRWTEIGLRYFLAECGFPLEQVQTDSWGNRQCLQSHAKQGACDFYIKYWHSLKNEKLYPASVWAIAKK